MSLNVEATTKINASPEDAYRFFEEMEVKYDRWHPDHVEFRWIDGGFDAGH